jgi:hypothetical protein
VRRATIVYLLPAAFCALPVLAAVLVALAVPADAATDYLRRVRHSPMDWLILALGFLLFVTQTALAWRALQWRGDAFDGRPDRWLTNLAQAAEWFPLLGLLGTVAGILQTFGAFQPGQVVTQSEVIRKYAPAITATGSGLFMALLNLLPSWIVTVGRDAIVALGGPPADTGDGRTP